MKQETDETTRIETYWSKKAQQRPKQPVEQYMSKFSTMIPQEENECLSWIKDRTSKSQVWTIPGERGGGKSCFAMALQEWHYKLHGRPCFAFDFPQPSLLPNFIKPIYDLTKLPKGAVVLIDEASERFSQFSFRSEDTQILCNLLKKARHKEISFIFVTQNTATLSRDIRRLIDEYVLKNPSKIKLMEETPTVKRMYQNCGLLFVTDKEKIKGFFIPAIGEMAYFDKPEWYTEELSHAYNGERETNNISTLINS